MARGVSAIVRRERRRALAAVRVQDRRAVGRRFRRLHRVLVRVCLGESLEVACLSAGFAWDNDGGSRAFEIALRASGVFQAARAVFITGEGPVAKPSAGVGASLELMTERAPAAERREWRHGSPGVGVSVPAGASVGTLALVARYADQRRRAAYVAAWEHLLSAPPPTRQAPAGWQSVAPAVRILSASEAARRVHAVRWLLGFAHSPHGRFFFSAARQIESRGVARNDRGFTPAWSKRGRARRKRKGNAHEPETRVATDAVVGADHRPDCNRTRHHRHHSPTDRMAEMMLEHYWPDLRTWVRPFFVMFSRHPVALGPSSTGPERRTMRAATCETG